MTGFVILERFGPALGLVDARSLPDAEALGRALWDRDVIAYHAHQMPLVAALLTALESQADARAVGAR